LKNQKMLLMLVGTIIELVGIVFIAISFGSDSSPMTGIYIMIIGTGVLVAGIRAKSQDQEEQSKQS
jgi:uncharacterized membrane protein YdjX (TVP38/TMEM64 family)